LDFEEREMKKNVMLTPLVDEVMGGISLSDRMAFYAPRIGPPSAPSNELFFARRAA
jgi:hypothetical protein